MKTKVCRVPSGGCGHGGYEIGLRNGLGQLWNRKIWNLFQSAPFNPLKQEWTLPDILSGGQTRPKGHAH